jgi:hypothetical protein
MSLKREMNPFKLHIIAFDLHKTFMVKTNSLFLLRFFLTVTL